MRPAHDMDIEKLGDLFPLLENVLSFGLYTHDLLSGQSYWSKGVYQMLALEEGSMEPKHDNFAKFIASQDQERVIEARSDNFALKQNYGIEFSLVNARGEFKRLYAETLFKLDEKGTIVGINGVVKDITESYKYKQALEEKVALLDKSNLNLQEFVYVASHDLQEPVRKISTFAERLGAKFGAQLGDEGKMYLKRMQNASLSMQILLEDLLSFSRLSFTDLPFERVPLRDCIESALADLEVIIEDTQTEVRLGEMPTIEGYPTQLRQLFNNLLGNAVKFRRPGVSPRITIVCSRINPYSLPQISLLKNTHYVKIEISDNGIGFEEEYSERIFLMFQRLNSRAEYSGSGIGLSICKKIVENHSGHITAVSTLNAGSTFTILLPYTIS